LIITAIALNDQWLDVYKFELFYLGFEKLLQSWKKNSVFGINIFAIIFKTNYYSIKKKLSIKFWQSLEITDMKKSIYEIHVSFNISLEKLTKNGLTRKSLVQSCFNDSNYTIKLWF
jgi:hypothetical protein